MDTNILTNAIMQQVKGAGQRAPSFYSLIAPYVPFVVSGSVRIVLGILLCYGIFNYLEKMLRKRELPREVKATIPVLLIALSYLVFPHREFSLLINIAIGVGVGTFATSVYDALIRRLLKLIFGGVDAASRKVIPTAAPAAGNNPPVNPPSNPPTDPTKGI